MAKLRAVCESVQENYIKFIPDDQSSAILVKSDQLTTTVQVGNVYDLTVDKARNVKKVENLAQETTLRKERIKSKRQRLLKRK